MEHEHEHHDSRTVVTDREEVVTNLDRPPLLSWGAIIGGLVFLIAMSWLLTLLGAAMGVSIADATDGDAIGNGLSIGAIIWMVLSALVVYFLGSLLTARLSGKVDSMIGMLHGLTLWGVATTLMIVLSYIGVTNLLQTGASLVSTTASAMSSTASEVASGVVSAGSMAADAADTELADNIQARLKRRAAAVVARSETPGGASVSSEEVRQAIDSLDAETLQNIATAITMGENTNAREALADATKLSEMQVNEIVDGISNQFEQEIGAADNNTDLVGDVTNSLQRQTADFVAELDAQGGAQVSQQDVRQAMEQLTPQNLQTVALRIAQGNVQGARDTLTAHTNLSTRQVNDIVKGVNADVERSVEQYREEASRAVEAASSYTQAVLWTVFLAGAMGLAVSLLGGWLGAETSRKLELEVHRDLV